MIRIRRLTVSCLILSAHAGGAFAFGTDHVFVQALKSGSASAPIADDPVFSRATASLQKQARSPAPIYIEAKRLTTFAQQGRCGRIAFIISQPASHHVWANLGGELNICDDGQPPLRVCPRTPRLVPAAATCPDGSRPVDSDEVASAIQAAISAGGMTSAQARARFVPGQPAERVQGTPR